MKTKSSEILHKLESVSYPEDRIYEVFKREKKSSWFHFWDIIFDVIPSTTTKLLYDKVVYLVASEKYGKIVEFRDNEIVKTLNVPNWTSDMKENFKKIHLENYTYTKFKKIK